MPVIVQWPASATARLDARLEVIKGRGSESFMDQAEALIKQGNADDRLRGVDRYGRPLVPLKSARKGRYKGATGPPLAPFGSSSRVVSRFVTRRGRRGGDRFVEAGWSDVLSKQGRPFLQFHIRGSSPMPRRDIAGLSPQTWARIRDAFRRWASGAFRRRS